MGKFGLGKGLGALIPQDQEAPSEHSTENILHQVIDDLDAPEEEEVMENTSGVTFHPAQEPAVKEEVVAEDGSLVKVLSISPDSIDPNPYQPRKRFEPESLHELGESIKKHGIIQPLVVTKKADGRYELVAGERRLQAAKLVGLSEVPAILRLYDLGNQEKLELAIIENLQREDLNIIEEGRAFQRLHDEFGLTYDEVAEKVGKSRPAVSNVVRLLQLPVEIQRALMDGKISEGHGRALLQVNDREGQLALYEMIVKKRLATDQAMALSKEWTNRPQLLKTNNVRDREVHALQNHLRTSLGVKSLLITRSDNGGGKILIQCLTDEEFKSLIDKLNSLN